jgi:hypothetical protein
VVMRTKASLGPTAGMGLSASSIRLRSTNTAALIIFDIVIPFDRPD